MSDKKQNNNAEKYLIGAGVIVLAVLILLITIAGGDVSSGHGHTH